MERKLGGRPRPVPPARGRPTTPVLRDRTTALPPNDREGAPVLAAIALSIPSRAGGSPARTPRRRCLVRSSAGFP